MTSVVIQTHYVDCQEARLNMSFLLAAGGEVNKAKEQLALAAKNDRSVDLGPMVPRQKKKLSPFHKARFS